MCENEKFFLGKVVDDGDDRKLWFARGSVKTAALLWFEGSCLGLFLGNFTSAKHGTCYLWD